VFCYPVGRGRIGGENQHASTDRLRDLSDRTLARNPIGRVNYEKVWTSQGSGNRMDVARTASVDGSADNGGKWNEIVGQARKPGANRVARQGFGRNETRRKTRCGRHGHQRSKSSRIGIWDCLECRIARWRRNSRRPRRGGPVCIGRDEGVPVNHAASPARIDNLIGVGSRRHPVRPVKTAPDLERPRSSTIRGG
jgi:hypothetical protein